MPFKTLPARSLKLDCEANLQAEFYHACRLIGLPVALEVTTRVGRHDAVILTHDRLALVAIVEVKRNAEDFMDGRSPQIWRYKSLGLPVYGLANGKDPHRLAATIKERHANEPGLLLTDLAAERRAQQQKQREPYWDEMLLVRTRTAY